MNRFSPVFLSGLILASPAFAVDIIHQWKFDDGTDSIGGKNATLVGTATFAGSSLQLPGTGVFANYASVDITGSLNSNASLSVESWFTLTQLNVWSKVWMFGQNTGEPGRSYINFTPRTGIAGNVPKTDFNSASSAVEFNTTAAPNPLALAVATEYHVVTVYNSLLDTQSFYINGVLADTGGMGGGNVTQLAPNAMRFGAGFQFADLDMAGTIDEISIWNGALTPAEVVAEFNAGPDVVAVPEPASIFALGLGGLLLAARRRRA